MASFLQSNSSILADKKQQFLQRQSTGAYPPQTSIYYKSIEVPRHCQFTTVDYLVKRVLSNPEPFTEAIENLYDLQIDPSLFQIGNIVFESTDYEKTYEHHILRVYVSINPETKGVLVEFCVNPLLSGVSSFDKEFESFMIKTNVWYAIHDAVTHYSDDCERNSLYYQQFFDDMDIPESSSNGSQTSTLSSENECSSNAKTEPETPYFVDPEYVYAESLSSNLYDKQKVDDIVFIGMCDLYGKVIPPLPVDIEQPVEPHMPYHRQISEQSYIYTSEYEHNKLDVMIYEQNPHRIERTMYVRFTIVPKYTPTDKCMEEESKINEMVLKTIYAKLYDYFEHLRNREDEHCEEYDEHSRNGQWWLGIPLTPSGGYIVFRVWNHYAIVVFTEWGTNIFINEKTIKNHKKS